MHSFLIFRSAYSADVDGNRNTKLFVGGNVQVFHLKIRLPWYYPLGTLLWKSGFIDKISENQHYYNIKQINVK